MDSIKEKDVRIEIGNITDNLDIKANEISLNEVENDEGYQYIQIKNTDSINNTKGIETENNNDEILFKKLYETETTTIKGMEETIDQDTNILNETQNQDEINKDVKIKINYDDVKNNININTYSRDTSDRINDQSERQFFEKVIIRNEEPYEELTSENYSISRCPKITTVKFEGESFSYLTNPENDENFFFIKLNLKKNLFEICDLDEYKKNHFDSTRIPYNQLLNFTSEINFAIQDLNKEVKKKRLSIMIWNILKVLISFGILFFIAYWLFFNGESFFSISANANRNIFYGFSLIAILILAFLIYSLKNDLNLNFELCNIYLSRQKDLEEIIEKWNQDYFIQNLNMICSIPYTFPYVQITLQPNIIIYLEEHDILD